MEEEGHPGEVFFPPPEKNGAALTSFPSWAQPWRRGRPPEGQKASNLDPRGSNLDVKPSEGAIN